MSGIGCEMEQVCRYAPCHIVEICKFRDMDMKALALKKDPIKKQQRNNREDMVMSLSTSNEDIKKARCTLREFKSQGKLGPNQLKALQTTAGKHSYSLTDIEKEQILSILQNALKGEKH